MGQEVPKSKKFILCAQDDVDGAELVAMVLGSQQYRVDIVSTFYGSLVKARENDYDLILLDDYFPDGSGLELCQQIRQFDRRTPILFYSSEARGQQIEACIEAGAQLYLIKPVDPEFLIKSVQYYIGELSGKARGQ